MSLRERKLEQRYRNILEVEHKNTFSSLENIDSRGNLILYRFNLKSTEPYYCLEIYPEGATCFEDFPQEPV
jgi:hypothetical protein